MAFFYMSKLISVTANRIGSVRCLRHLFPGVADPETVYGKRQCWLRNTSRLVAAIGFIFISTTQARASLIQDFELTGNPNLTGSGFFEFSTTSGGLAANTIAYSGIFTLFGVTINTGLADINTSANFRDIDYTIDAAWNLILNSGTIDLVPGVDPQGAIRDFLGFGASRFFAAEYECFGISGCAFPKEFISERATIVFTPRHEAVPVPAAVWLFGSGLIGLIGMARRQKAE